MEILIRSVDDWGEVYVNGKFIYDGEWSLMEPVMEFLNNLRKVDDIEIRLFEAKGGLRHTVDTDGNPTVEYHAPLHAITGNTYETDWDKAETIPVVTEEESD
ncbi:MAG: hypothetical protein ACXAC2_00645 [Candidatus Kariarchaeaceae archaeon]|jgi:hypothetical protein